MKAMFKMVSALLVTMLVLAAFPTMGVDAAHYRACDQAAFIRDVTVPDGSPFAPGETFTKTWRLQNTGTCTWTTSNYTLVYFADNDFGATKTIPLPKDVPAWSYIDLTVPDMVAPSTPGKYRSSWKLDNGSGYQFGVGWGGRVPIFALIRVVTPPSVTYDFEAQAPSAIWTSGAGPGGIPFPGTPGDPGGSASSLATPTFENGVTASNPGLLVSPNNAYNGFIEGNFTDKYTVKKGDRFQTTVGCESTATGCYVAFSLKYQIDGPSGPGPVHTLWTFRERYEGLTYSANVNLDWLAGKTVYFILSMSAYGSPVGDSAIWGHPVIVGIGGGSGISPTGWSSNDMGNFTFDFPSNSVVSNVNEVLLPIIPGTNLNRKYVEVSTKNLAAAGDPCLSSNPGPSAPTPVTFNGVEFMKETGGDGGAGNFQEWVSYSAENPYSPLACVSLTFVMSYSNAGNFDPPRPEFNQAAEAAVFDLIMGRFKWVD